jgi:outer membrane protein OmpA-like peptidoglycan-associated protein
MRRILTTLPFLLALGSCTSPPKPPGVDESRRRPANAAAEVDLQVCKGDLQNTKVAARESALVADAARATAAQLRLQRQSATPTRPPEARNTIHTILFAFGSSRIDLRDDEARRLVEEAQRAPLILLSGRTDGTTPTAGESRIARERADAVKAYLVQAGIDPARIRATWQPVGDHAADNASERGRSLNRRVEIELYRFAPRHASLEPEPERAD